MRIGALIFLLVKLILKFLMLFVYAVCRLIAVVFENVAKLSWYIITALNTNVG